MAAIVSNLVFWPEENAWSLVQYSAVDQEAAIGSETLVKFKGKKYPAILIAKGAYSFLKSEGKKFQGYLNTLLFEEETTDDIIRRIREEYLNTTNTVNVPADDHNPVATPVTPLAKPLTATKTVERPTPLGAGSKTAAVNDASITRSESDMDSNKADVVLLKEDAADDTEACSPSTSTDDTEFCSPFIKKFKSSNTDFVTKEELDAVVDDLRSLRRRVRKLEGVAAAKTTKAEKSETDIDLKQLIENADNEFNAVEILLLHFFDEETILQSSVSGKRANTKVNQASVKKALNFTKINKIKSVLKSKYPSIKQKDITQKIHSVQKKLQRRSSKE